MKNSSRFEEKIEQNFTRSSSGTSGSAIEVEDPRVEVEPGQLSVQEPRAEAHGSVLTFAIPR